MKVFKIVFIIVLFSSVVNASVDKIILGTVEQYNNKASDIKHGKNTAFYITKNKEGFAFVRNGEQESSYKEIRLVSYSDDKQSYAYVGIDDKDNQVIIFNGKRLRHVMDNIISLSVASGSYMYVGKKDDKYYIYLNRKKIHETTNEITSALLFENNKYLISIKDNASYQILLGDDEIKRSVLQPTFYSYGDYTIVLHSDSEGANNKDISIFKGYKALQNFDGQTFQNYNRISDFYQSANSKSYVLVAHKSSSKNPTVIANGKVYSGLTKFNDVIFSDDGQRYLINANKVNGGYAIGDNDEFGPYDGGIVDMAFSKDSSAWGLLGRRGNRTAIVVDGEGYVAYYYAGDLHLSSNGSQWIVVAAHGSSQYFIDFNGKIQDEHKKIYNLSMSKSIKRMGYIYSTSDDAIKINIDGDILKYNASKEYPFIAITDKSYAVIVENENDTYSIVENGRSHGNFTDIYQSPKYIRETNSALFIARDGDEVGLYQITLR